MRALHEPGKHEALVARGEYRERQEGTDTGTLERWNLHRLPDGSSVLRADHTQGETSLLVHALLDPQGRADRVRARFRGGQQQAEVELLCFPDHALVRHSTGGLPPARSEVELPEGAVVLAPCVAHNIASGVDAREGEPQSLPVLDMDASGEGGELLAPRLRHVQVAFEGTDEIDVPGAGRIEARRFGIDEQQVWLDAHGTVLAVESEAWTIKLTHYARFGDQERGA